MDGAVAMCDLALHPPIAFLLASAADALSKRGKISEVAQAA